MKENEKTEKNITEISLLARNKRIDEIVKDWDREKLIVVIKNYETELSKLVGGLFSNGNLLMHSFNHINNNPLLTGDGFFEYELKLKNPEKRVSFSPESVSTLLASYR